MSTSTDPLPENVGAIETPENLRIAVLTNEVPQGQGALLPHGYFFTRGVRLLEKLAGYEGVVKHLALYCLQSERGSIGLVISAIPIWSSRWTGVGSREN